MSVSVIELLELAGAMTFQQIVRKSGMSQHDCSKRLNDLVSTGRIVRNGTRYVARDSSAQSAVEAQPSGGGLSAAPRAAGLLRCKYCHRDLPRRAFYVNASLSRCMECSKAAARARLAAQRKQATASPLAANSSASGRKSPDIPEFLGASLLPDGGVSLALRLTAEEMESLVALWKRT